MQRRTITKIDLSQNLVFYYIAIGIIAVGYVVLGIGSADSISSRTIGPIIIVLGYLVAVPLALLIGSKKSSGISGNADKKPPSTSK